MSSATSDWIGSADCPTAHVKHDVLLVHASPRDHIYEYVLDTAVAHANLELLNGGICFHGHTHVPGIFGLVGRAR